MAIFLIITRRGILVNINDFKKIKISNTKFCHYTTISNARNIVSNDGSIYLSKFSMMNDKDEESAHNDEDDCLFSFSMCHSNAKDIPLFYLYSGIDGKGCRIEFTKNKLNSIFNGVVVPVNKKMVMLKKSFDPNDYEIMVGWIHYLSNDGTDYYKRNEYKRYPSLDDAKKELERINEHYFIKRKYWEYEKEFRIIIKFKQPVAYDRVAIRFPISRNESGISMKCGPELSDEELQDVREEFKDYGIKKIDRFNDIEIKMDLVSRNKELLKNV